MLALQFETKLFAIGNTTILQLPAKVSAKLPSRGMVLVEGSVNGAPFLTALEPDGKGSHWLNMREGLLKATNAKSGDTVSVVIEPSKDWPEPEVPQDLQRALKADQEARAI